MTDKRLNKVVKVVSARQKGLTVVLENVHDPHNVSAVIRTAESVGIDKIYLIYNKEKFPSWHTAGKYIKFTNLENFILTNDGEYLIQ